MSFVTKKNTEDIYPLSPTQKGMLFHSLYDEKTPLYFEQLCFTVNGPLDTAAFKDSWDHLVSLNSVLRTVFKWHKIKEPLQIVLKTRPMDFNIHNLENLKLHQQKEVFENFLIKDKENLFDLENGPLVRFNLFRLGPNTHRILWSYHHIILDGWGLPVLLQDLFFIYMARIVDSPLPRPKRRPYKDYIAWYLKQDQAAARDFWQGQLADFMTPTPLPVDLKPSPGYEIHIDEEELLLSERMTTAVQDLVKKEHVTQSVLMQLVWATILSYYSSQDDVVFGSTVSGRPADLKGSDKMLGLFINTLPVRIKLTDDMMVPDLLQTIQKLTLAVREYEYSFLLDVKACSGVSKAQNLFESNFVFENYPLSTAETSIDNGFGVSDISSKELTNFPLSFVVLPGKRMSIRLQYDNALFKQETIQRMKGHVNEVLTRILENPNQKISDLGVLTPEEQYLFEVSFNNTQHAYPEEKNLNVLFEAQVDKVPEQPAVAFQDKSLTYRELNAQANQLARYLRGLGAGPEVRIGVMTGTPIETILGILGILKSGAAYLPIDVAFPKDRIDFLLKDSEAPIVITLNSYLDKISDYKGRIVCLDNDQNPISAHESTNPGYDIIPRDTAYVIYTSGSTGKPKGTLIPHQGVVNLVWALEKEIYARYDGSLRVAQLASFTFDASVQQIFAALILGHILYPIPGDMKKDISLLIPYILDHQIEIIDGTPSLWELLVKGGISEKSDLNLKHVIIGGEALTMSLLKRFYQGPYGRMVKWTNVYGVTESSVDSTSFLADVNTITTEPFIPIGKPLANTRLYILNSRLKPMPVGMPGELYIAGDGLAKGYLNNPEKTQANFIENPFQKGTRLYKTGDLAKWLPDGNIVFLGRIDFQVKIRGYRIELGEIETVLSERPDISDCVVVDKEDHQDNKYLAAYYVSDKELSVTDLREFLGKTLPDYMIPLRFMRLDALPLNPSGKVDRKSLPDPDGYRPVIETEYAAPRNDVEQVLTEVWQKVLRLDKVGIYDNFFDLGGDSIISLQITGSLKKRGYQVLPRDIFENQTVAELAPIAEKSMLIRIDQGPVTGIAPLTPIQKNFFSMNLENENHFNQILVFKSALDIDAAALRTSLQAMLDHHDALRMRFADGKQENTPPGEGICFTTKQVDDRHALENEINQLQAFLDIKQGPVFAAGLFQMSGASYLVFVGHHLIIDGVSWRILLEDMFTGYSQALSGKEIQLPEKTTSYKDWADKLAAYAMQADLKDEAVFWNNETAHMVIDIPVDHDSGPNDMASSDVMTVELDESDTGNLLKDANNTYNTEVNDLLLTALTRTLTHWTGKNETVFDLEGHGREDVLDKVDISRTIGWFTAIYPVKLGLNSQEDISEQIKYVKEKLRAIPRKGIHYGVLKYLNGGKTIQDTNRQICFNYLGQVNISSLGDAFELDNKVVFMPSDPANKRPYLIDINCMVENSKLMIHLGYTKSRFAAATIQSLAQQFKTEIENVVRYCMGDTTGGYTPSDFDLADISQDQLDDLVADLDI